MCKLSDTENSFPRECIAVAAGRDSSFVLSTDCKESGFAGLAWSCQVGDEIKMLDERSHSGCTFFPPPTRPCMVLVRSFFFSPQLFTHDSLKKKSRNVQQSGHDNGQRIATEAVKGTVFVTFSSFCSLFFAGIRILNNLVMELKLSKMRFSVTANFEKRFVMLEEDDGSGLKLHYFSA